MPSMSLSDCQSLTLNVKMGLSQFFRNSHSKESGYFTASLTARWRGGPLGPDGEGRRKKKRRPTVRGGGVMTSLRGTVNSVSVSVSVSV